MKPISIAYKSEELYFEDYIGLSTLLATEIRLLLTAIVFYQHLLL